LKLVTSAKSSGAKKEQPEKKLTSSKKAAVSKEKKLDYPSARIGKQVWMVENLNVDHFRNGDLIPEAKTDKAWKQAAKEGKPAWCYYENDSAYGKKYGKLYNWFAVCDPRGLAPEGWQVPSDNEWLALTGGAAGEGGYLLEFGDWDWKTGEKMKSTYGWNRYCRRKDGEMESGNGTNNSGFYGLPGGCRHSDGPFFFIGDSGNWWSSTKGKTRESAWSRTLRSSSESVERDYNDKGKGFSVRCLKD
jgi:uncharacterized protein (TIGR02145 family)